jgi:putative FmdB family regulatory protein
MPIYSYRCRSCGGVTDAYASIDAAPEAITCEHCGRTETYRVVGRVAYHASENAKTARLDPKYEKRVDDALRKSSNADPDRLLRKMKPFGNAKE